jgi:hypothetical protein
MKIGMKQPKCVFPVGEYRDDPKCGKDASTFLRVASGRLRPLCPECFDRHERIFARLQPKSIASLKGGGKYTVVSLEEGIEEFQKQSP